MRKILCLSIIIVAFTVANSYAGFGSLLKAVKGGDKHELTLSAVNPAWAKYEGTEFDPVKDEPEAYKYTTYGDPEWDTLVKSCSEVTLTVAFAEKISASPNATAEDVALASTSLQPLITKIPELVTSAVAFGQGVVGDPTKAVMLKDVKKVTSSVKSIKDKLGGLTTALKAKTKEPLAEVAALSAPAPDADGKAPDAEGEITAEPTSPAAP